jgi:hypothetical protein
MEPQRLSETGSARENAKPRVALRGVEIVPEAAGLTSAASPRKRHSRRSAPRLSPRVSAIAWTGSRLCRIRARTTKCAIRAHARSYLPGIPVGRGRGRPSRSMVVSQAIPPLPRKSARRAKQTMSSLKLLGGRRQKKRRGSAPIERAYPLVERHPAHPNRGDSPMDVTKQISSVGVWALRWQLFCLRSPRLPFGALLIQVIRSPAHLIRWRARFASGAPCVSQTP